MRISSRSALLLFLLAAFALRLYRLGVESLWYDETVSLFLARQDLVSLTRHTAGDIHPPLYYYILHFWGRLAGWSEFSAAFLSLFFGVLLSALVYRVAREWIGGRVALVAAFLVALSPYNLYYSQEVRMYTLGATLGLASVYFLVRLLGGRTEGERPETRRTFGAYVIVSALGLYTLYYFAFLLVFENLAALVWRFRNSRFAARKWVVSQIAILLLYAPWIPVAIRQAIDPPVPPWRSFTPLPHVLIESFSALSLGQSVDPAVVWPVLIAVLAILAFALWQDGRHPGKDRRSSVSALFVLAYTLVPLFVVYGMSLWKPLYHVRYVFIYSPGFYLLLAIGLSRIYDLRFTPFLSRNLGAGLAVAGLLLVAGTSAYSAYNFWFDPRYAADDLRGAVRYLAERWRPGDAVLIDAGYAYTAFVYYYDQPIAWRGRLINYPPLNTSLGSVQRLVDRRTAPVVLQTGSIGGNPGLGWDSPESDFYVTTAEETRAALERVFALHPRVWLLRLYDTVVDPQGIIRDYLARRGRILDDQGFAGESFGRVQGYLTTQAPLTALPASATRREVLLGARVALLGFEPLTATVRADTPLDVTLYWRAQQPTNIDEHLFVGLFVEDGGLVASSDQVPLGNALGTSRWTSDEIWREPVRLIVPANVSPGIYVLRVAMYNPLTNEPLAAEKSEWVAENYQIKLTKVHVEK